MSTRKISAVLIVLNEAEIITPTLDALSWCDEIIVVDSGSTDGTVEICQQKGCKVIYRAFDGYGPQKAFAFAQASNDWILSIDADEVLSDGLRAEIQNLIRQDSIPHRGYNIPRSMIFMGQKIRSEYGRPCLRLFDRRHGGVTLDQVHEVIKVEGRVGKLRHQLWHYSYRDLHEYFRVFNKYTSMAADELYHKGKKKPKWMIMVRMPLAFFKLYIVQGCILNGFAGFVWSLCSALYPVIKYSKLQDKYRRELLDT